MEVPSSHKPSGVRSKKTSDSASPRRATRSEVKSEIKNSYFLIQYVPACELTCIRVPAIRIIDPVTHNRFRSDAEES